MAKTIDIAIFDRYRDQARVRWIECEIHRVAHNHEYGINRKLSRWLNIATVIAALATAVFATLQNFDAQFGWAKTGTLVTGLITGAIPTLKEAFKWDKRATEHKKFADMAKSMMLDLRTWLEKLSFGQMAEEGETMISRADDTLKKLLDGEAPALDSYRSRAELSVKGELDRISFIMAVEPVAEIQELDAPEEEEMAGFDRAIRT